MTFIRSALRSTLILAVVVAAGCATQPQHRRAETRQLNTRVIAYPAQGQSPEQLDRDRYECHLWAVRQSRFDPSAPGVPASYRVRVEPAPQPGAATAVGAITGAVLGAAVGAPHDEGAGAIVGAIAGAAVEPQQIRATPRRRSAPRRALIAMPRGMKLRQTPIAGRSAPV